MLKVQFDSKKPTCVSGSYYIFNLYTATSL